MRTRRAFTVMELMVTITLLTILVSIAMVSYHGYRDRAAMLVDETNQKILQAAVKLYAYDTNALPASLSELRLQDLQRAFALVTEGKRPYTFLAYLNERFGVESAEAQVLPRLPAQYYNNDPRVLTCPSDEAEDLGRSYGIFPEARRQPLSWLLDPGNADESLIVEVQGTEGGEFRHNGGKVKVVTTVSGKPGRKPRNTTYASGKDASPTRQSSKRLSGSSSRN